VAAGVGGLPGAPAARRVRSAAPPPRRRASARSVDARRRGLRRARGRHGSSPIETRG
jgi:hypothetical protein